jgi:NADH dehydrogenase (ubiquinone) 1 beta subcomplex subunit 10
LIFNSIVSDKVVDSFRISNKDNHYYHRKFRRIPSIDECEVGDEVCFYETNQQFKRDK